MNSLVCDPLRFRPDLLQTIKWLPQTMRHLIIEYTLQLQEILSFDQLPSGNRSSVDGIYRFLQHLIKLLLCLIHIQSLGQRSGKAGDQTRIPG